MASQPSLNERDLHLAVAYSLSRGEEVTEAIVNAFRAANVDPFERSTVLADWIDPDVFGAVRPERAGGELDPGGEGW